MGAAPTADRLPLPSFHASLPACIALPGASLTRARRVRMRHLGSPAWNADPTGPSPTNDDDEYPAGTEVPTEPPGVDPDADDEAPGFSDDPPQAD